MAASGHANRGHREDLAAFHPDGKFELAGSKEHTPVTGSAQGHQELRATLAKPVAAFQFVERDIVNLVIEDERAAVHSRVKLRFVPKDRAVTTDLIDLWKFRDGKVVEFVVVSRIFRTFDQATAPVSDICCR